MEAFINLIIHLGVPIILLVVFAESGLLIGFIFPGDSLLFTAAYMVQQHILPIDIHLFAILVFLAAVLGERNKRKFKGSTYLGRTYNLPFTRHIPTLRLDKAATKEFMNI